MSVGQRLACAGWLVAVGCGPKPPPPSPPVAEPAEPVVPVAEPPATSGVHPMSDNWGSGPGCTPHGETMTLEGIVRVRPFGKGTDGAIIDTGNGEWVVSYRAEGILLQLDGQEVVATGRPCDKQGEAVFGVHFDLATLEAKPPP